MKKVFVYSLLLIAGLVGSQLLPPPAGGAAVIRLATMAALAFIMIHVGYEFDLDKTRPGHYARDAAVAMTAAVLPWALCTLYFVFVMTGRGEWGAGGTWRKSLLHGLFAAPTSAGVLFSMLAAAGLGATWVFGKARVLAIFDDLGTVLLMIPLKVMLVGPRWQLGVVVVVLGGLLWLAWRHLHAARLPVGWPWVLGYAAGITAATEFLDHASRVIDPGLPIHVEVLLPAFALGCVLARPPGADPHSDDAREGVEEGPESPAEQRVATVVSACFMVLVGLSMPPVVAGGGSAAGPAWGTIALHVLAVTVLSNVGKLFPLFRYRAEATPRERLALSVGMFPRGEVGAGVLVVALSYGIAGPTLTVAVLSLALNLLGTGFFILVVKKLLAKPAPLS